MNPRSVLRAALAVVSVIAAPAADAFAAAPPAHDVVAVIVGANLGSSDDEPLRFAASDANRFRDLLTEIGDVRPERALLVLGGGPAEVIQALKEARGRAAELAGSGHRVTLVFYYSGHGDDDTLHLTRGVLPLRDLRQAVAEVPADLRLSILDACRTGGRTRGTQRGASFELRVAPDEPRGTVEMRAASLGEAAQESDELGGAVFTHFLVSGLRGAADGDGDGRVTLSELYSYAYRRTLARTASAAAVVQHPAMAMDLAGAGDVVLTYPARATAFLEVPRGSERYLVFARPSDVAVGELTGEGAARIALPAGRFLVVRRAGDRIAVASVDLSWGGRRALAPADFTPMTREQLLARGGRVELRPWRLEGRAGAQFVPGAPDAVAFRAGPALAYGDGRIAYELDVGYVGGPFSSATFASGWVHSISTAPDVAVRFFLDRVTLSLLVGAELRYSWEHLERTDAARARAAGLAATEDRSFGAVIPRAGVRVALPLGRDWNAGVTVASGAMVRNELRGDGTEAVFVRPTVSSTLALGFAF